ncbi:hypothetical protein EAX61_04655 [Dokdonia sinensis]|uniref:Sugar transporter n=1 Tax=Dokdonia sinensis TaxID=2479847 RepID=A0A3M0GCJ7_9FLAO|nr:hypothetical protein [Dokdonia sinensis]RMB62871.1 hypothetical protein EAX61_04655 [Dokdonia sinensis]
MRSESKPPVSFWIVAVFAIIWNVAEVYFSSFELSFLERNLTAEQFKVIESIPIWYSVVFLAALFSEFLGSLMLFMRKKIATLFFGISFITLVFVESYWLLYYDIKNVSIVISTIVPILVIAVAGFLYFYSRNATRKDWIS